MYVHYMLPKVLHVVIRLITKRINAGKGRQRM